MSLRALLPAHIRKQWDEEDAKNAKLAAQLQLACADAIEVLASAIRNPRISRVDLQAAYRSVVRAQSIVDVLDPEDS